MSYASVAAHNAPPESEQPRPDPGLLEGQNVDHSDVNNHLPDVDSGKVNVIPSDADLEHLKTESQEAYEKAVAEAREARAQAERDAKAAKDKAAATAKDAGDKAEKAAKDVGDKAKQLGNEADKAASDASSKAQQYAKDAQNLAKDAGNRASKLAGDAKKEVEKDTRELRKRAKEEGKKIKKAAGEAGEEIESFWNRFSSDPDMWLPALGALNVALLGGLGFYAYTNKDQVQRTDRRLLSAVTVGILGLVGGQGYWAQETARKQRRSL
ncbi:uncharacterized protein PFL1_04750 [Pseudozyma flocculosa PF-1]|uniref:Mitochondrial outer membrane protein OM14 C-terminal domain-containing protein n=2 Tax=Pseudozyma flocculosa TaxID=84751 RepID=A0A5C3F733_9BASI|nr:uncharacterized protein PFL1_04750 [Pseudozyma flocculosa PF-1]EPQ27612.1 hypothetical protein PFL1_04750 [Pseudozyma flocculosa PF-1]SPO39259.1 uncharacterized protein PSFLO_04739 [Pseudozyma flocculosa]